MNEEYKRQQGLLALLLAMFGLLQAWLLLSPDALLMSLMEADVYHILDGAFRLRDGQVQHLDFKTPLGALALNAVAAPLKLGLTPGAAMAWANIAAMALVVPMVLWLHATRMSFRPALGLGMAAMLVAASLIWGGGELGSSFAMFYNRWCWALLMVALAVLILPARGRRDDLIDGLIIGVIAAAFFYLKITYAVGFVLIGVVWMLSLRRWRAVGAALVACLVALAAITGALGGMDMLGGYMDDLADVSANTLRPRPGGGFIEVATRADVMAVTLTLFAGIVVLVRAGFGKQAAVWAAAAAAIYYIAFQNYANWPTGAIAAPFILWAFVRHAPVEASAFGVPARRALGLLGVGLAFGFAPTLVLMQSSLVATFLAQSALTTPILARYGAPDLAFSELDGGYYALDRIDAGASEDPQGRVFAGVTIPPCVIGAGAESLYPALAEEMRASLDLTAKRILLAEAINPMWFLTGTEPMKGVHIWYYVPLGERLEDVDLFVVAFCALARPQRNAIIDEVTASGLDFAEALRTPHFVIFERRR